MNKFPSTTHAAIRCPSPDERDHGAFTLVLESESRRESLDSGIIQQAMCGPVFILDAGNCFNPLRLTRQIRRQTIQIQRTLDHIQVARAFTCYQVISLLEKTQNPRAPVFILRLLTSFADEMATVSERLRLLRQVDAHIDRLRSTASVTVMIKNTHFHDELLLDWFTKLQNRADEFIFPKLSVQPQPATLF